MAKEKKKKNSNKIGIGKFWGWQARAISMGGMTIILGYLSLYCTDTLMIPAGIVGMILLVSKVFDGVTDIIAGFIIDNTQTKLGKARPYELMIIALWLCTWLLYSCPEKWGMTVKCVWIFIMYTLVNSIFATFLYQNQNAYMLRTFKNQEQIIKVNSYGGIVITIGCAVVSMLFPQMMASMATSGEGWSKLIAIFAIPLLVIGLGRFLLVKEDIELEDDDHSKVHFSDIIDVLKHNKYIYIVAGISLLYNLVLGMNAYTYYFTWIGGGIDKYTTLAAVSMPLLIVMFIFPAIMKKGVPVSKIILFGSICGVLGYGMNFFAGDNLTVLLIAAILYTFAGLPIAYISGLMLLDCAEYNVLCGRKRMETTVSAISSFGTKLGQGLGAGLLGIMLSVFGYAGGAKTQTDGAILGIRCLYSFIPAAIYLLIAVLCLVYKLDKELVVLRAKTEEK